MILGGPFWGLIADKWHCHRIVILMMCICSLLTISTQPFVGLHFGNPETNKCPYVKETASKSINASTGKVSGEYYVRQSIKHLPNENLTVNLPRLAEENITIHSLNNARVRVLSQRREPTNRISKSDITLPSKDPEPESTKSNHYPIHKDSKPNSFGTLYFAMYAINFLVSFAEGSAVGFVDAGTMRRSQLATKRPLDYGRQRMFSSFGGAFGILVTNLAIDYFPASNITCYTGVFVVYGLLTVSYCISTMTLFRGLSFRNKPADHDTENASQKTTEMKELLKSENNNDNSEINLTKFDAKERLENAEKSDKKNLRKILFRTLFQTEMIFFYLTAFVSGLEYSQSTNFLYPYLQEMNAPSILLTLSIVFSNFASVIGFAFCQDMIRILGGTWRAFTFSFLIYLIRYLGVSYIQNPWLVLIFQPMHALSAVIFVAGGLMHLRQTSPIPVMTTLISLFNTTHFGLGTIIGSSISGIIYEKYGGRTLFKSTSMLAVVWLLVLIVYIVLVVRRRERKEKEGTEKANDLLLMEPVKDCAIKDEKA